MGGTDKAKTARQIEFGDRVRARRQDLKLSQEALALHAHIHRSYIASLEAGRRNPSLDLISRLAAALRIDAAELVRGLQAVKGR